jgi:Tfp pilus tip-associated adhesin PilY1
MGDLDGKYWRFNFTTGGGVTTTEMSDTQQPIYGSSALLVIGTTEQYAFFSTGSDLLPRTAPGGTGPFHLYSVRDFGSFPRNELKRLDWLETTGSGKSQVTSTFIERPSSSPSVAGDIVFFTTTLDDTSPSCSSNAVQGRLYAFTYLGGPAYDTNNSSSLTSADSSTIKTVSGRATAPFIVDQHLYFATSGPGGATLEAFGNPEDYNNGVGQVGVRILSWRELR